MDECDVRISKGNVPSNSLLLQGTVVMKNSRGNVGEIVREVFKKCGFSEIPKSYEIGLYTTIEQVPASQDVIDFRELTLSSVFCSYQLQYKC